MKSLCLNKKTTGICGVFIAEGGVEVPLYFNEESGEIFYYYDSGKQIQTIDNLKLMNLSTCVDYMSLMENILNYKYGEGVIGVILCSTYAVMITSDLTAEKRSYEDLTSASECCFMIDMMIEGKNVYN